MTGADDEASTDVGFQIRVFIPFRSILPEYMGQSGLEKGSLTMWKAYELSSILGENVYARQNLHSLLNQSINLVIKHDHDSQVQLTMLWLH